MIFIGIKNRVVVHRTVVMCAAKMLLPLLLLLRMMKMRQRRRRRGEGEK